jgi:hypothetical protein
MLTTIPSTAIAFTFKKLILFFVKKSPAKIQGHLIKENYFRD